MKGLLIYLTEQQHKILKEKSEKFSVSMGSIIRDALNKYLEDGDG